MKDENWERFMPQFKKQNVKRKKPTAEDKKKKKKEYTPFPPEQLPRKEDLQMMSGEYFLSDKAKDKLQKEKKREQKEARKEQKIQDRNKTLQAPEDEDAPEKVKYENRKPTDIDSLKNKFLKKK